MEQRSQSVMVTHLNETILSNALTFQDDRMLELQGISDIDGLAFYLAGQYAFIS